MQLLCKSRLAKLFLKLVRGIVVQKLRCGALLNLLHGAVLQKLPFETIAQGFAWHHRARVVFRSYFLSFFMELSRGRGRAKLLLTF